MKKIIIILFIISSIYILKNKEEIIIPKDSIRFRIIASSNTIEDQKLKNNIKNDIINNILSNINNYNDINNNIPKIRQILDNYNIKYNLSYGDNYFPKKTYKGITYPSGYYKSLVITIDKGLGDNFWCIMYPPLCLIDNKETSNIEYKSIIKETLNKYNRNNE